VDRGGAAYVPYRAYPGFRYVSAADVFEKRVPIGDLEGRIVLVGTTAPGLLDLRVTPVANVYPGVEIHANMISGALDDTIRYQPGYARDFEIALVLVLGIALSVALPRLSAVRAAVLSGLVFVAVLVSGFLAWRAKLVLPVAGPALLVFLVAGFNMAWGFVSESRDRKKITGLFGQYVPPDLVKEMANDPANFSMRSESLELTVLFSDIRSFTTMSEGLTPTQLSDVLNAYLTEMTHVIHQRRGTIDKYIGDAIMAFWGAPIAVPGHAREAVLAGLEMQARLTNINRDFAEKGWPEIHIGVGINTGRMSVGNMGSEFRMAYTVMGDTVNLASRLEGLTKQYGARVLVGEQTREAVPDIVCLEVDRVRVKGKEKPVSIFEPLGDEASVGESGLALARRFGGALDAYRNRRWDEAETILGELAAESPRKLWDVYRERIAVFRAAPPPEGWDGVWVFETK
jgi:adenylate cyclase